MTTRRRYQAGAIALLLLGLALITNSVFSFVDRKDLRDQNAAVRAYADTQNEKLRQQIEQFERCKDTDSGTPGCEAPVTIPEDPPPTTPAEAVPGPQGPAGPPGQSITGSPGRDGRDGKDGADGESVVGPSGAPGQTVIGPSGAPGEPGRGVVSVLCTSNRLTVTYTGGQTVDVGSCGRGAAGERGQAGADGSNGKDGAAGKDGKDGRGLTSMVCGDNGRWQATYTDGTTADAGQCRVVAAPDPQPTPEPTDQGEQ